MKYTLLFAILTTCLYAAPLDESVIYPEDDGKKAALSSCKGGDCQPLAISKGRRDDDEPSPPPKPKSSMLDSITVSLPYAVEHYEAPAKSEPTYEMPRGWHHDDHDHDDHGHHGQVPEPGTWALIGCGLVALAYRRNKL